MALSFPEEASAFAEIVKKKIEKKGAKVLFIADFVSEIHEYLKKLDPALISPLAHAYIKTIAQVADFFIDIAAIRDPSDMDTELSELVDTIGRDMRRVFMGAIEDHDARVRSRTKCYVPTEALARLSGVTLKSL